MVSISVQFLKFVKRSDSMLNHAFRKQLLVSIIVNIINFAYGIALGWMAPVVQKIISVKTPLVFPVSLDEASWIASVVLIGALFGSLVLCSLNNVIGPKPCLLVLAIPNMILWILVYMAKNVELLCLARFVGGLSGGGALTIVPIFICDIADQNMRGVFQSFLALALNFGVLVGYIISSKLEFYLIPCILVVLPIVYFVLMFYFPETPQYLLRKGKDTAALDSFKFYKNFKEVTPKLQEEFDILKSAVCFVKSDNKLKLKDFVTKPALLAYRSGIVLLLLNLLCGINIFVNYMSTIFEVSGAPMDPDNCTIIIGIVQLCGSFVTILIVGHCERKKLIIVSSIGTALGLTAYGFATHLRYKFNEALFSWIPLTLMIFIIFISNIGIVSVILFTLVEIFPIKIFSTSYTILLILRSVIMFGSLKMFPIYMQKFGISMTMWSCATVTVFCLIYVIIYVPETKGKSMEKD